ncbi:Golgi-associated plant pathogenesis-related protein 1-like isoform X2 [Sparus aurata]|uniref:Im:7150988 n=2 Tax=Sparus aurata TaxID=8175 RepID=A0A671YVP4_SPAAU|nr:Golgi-associated plant pathogenesis-related protein 1-like isoform X2 [Sparus aurata]
MADSSFQQEFLATHNTLRKKHNTPPMVLDDELTASSQKWADHLLAINTLQHSTTDDGENVFTMSSSETLTLTGKEAVESWYSEIKDYDWGSPGFSGNTGHFTQVVWKDSTKLGVGMATNGKKVFVVGQYRPAGNMAVKEYFEKNVLPLA